jgi:hypothetical protein
MWQVGAKSPSSDGASRYRADPFPLTLTLTLTLALPKAAACVRRS